MPTLIESNPILSEMKKLVVKLEIYDDKAKQKALKTVSSLQGIDSMAVDLKERKLTVIGTVDPVNVVSKLRKYWQTDIVTVGPAMEPETKKEEPKHEGESGGDATAGKEQQDPNMMKPAGGGGGGGGDQQEKQKDEEKEGGDGKKGEAAAAAGAGEAKKVLELDDQELRRRIDPGALELVRPYTAYRAYNNPQLMASYYYQGQSMEENPNACSIC